MQEEIWKPVVGWEEFYEVSSEGRVRSKDRVMEVNDRRTGKYKVQVKGRILKPSRGKINPYPKYVLAYNGQKVSQPAHRLVAEAFIPNPENKPCVHHKDHDKTNCRLENLEWVTHKENTAEAKKAGLLGVEKKNVRRFTEVQLKWMKRLRALSFSEREIAEIFDTGLGYVRGVVGCDKKPSSNRKLKWCYSVPVNSFLPTPIKI